MSGTQLASALALNPSVLPSPDGWFLFPLNSPSWSLVLEFLINIVFCLALVFRSDRFMLIFTSISGLALASVAIVQGTIDQRWVWATFPGGLLRVSFSFGVGMLIQRRLVLPGCRPTTLAFLPPIMLLLVLCIPVNTDGGVIYSLICTFFLIPLLAVAGSFWSWPVGGNGSASA